MASSVNLGVRPTNKTSTDPDVAGAGTGSAGKGNVDNKEQKVNKPDEATKITFRSPEPGEGVFEYTPKASSEPNEGDVGEEGEGEGEKVEEKKEEVDYKTRAERAEALLEQERENSRFLKGLAERKGNVTEGVEPKKKEEKKVELGQEFFASLANPETADAALIKWAQAHGFMTQEQVEAALTSKVTEVTSLGTYYAKYPDLSDSNSQVHKSCKEAGMWVATRPEFAGLSEHAKNMMALEIGTSRFEAAKKAAEVKVQETKAEDNKRLQKARRQDNRVQPGGARQTPTGQGELTPEELSACQKWGISPEQYKKQKDRGIMVGPNAAQVFQGGGAK